jgi:hypothetical protein
VSQKKSDKKIVPRKKKKKKPEAREKNLAVKKGAEGKKNTDQEN